jgi:hypothetical protein
VSISEGSVVSSVLSYMLLLSSFSPDLVVFLALYDFIAWYAIIFLMLLRACSVIDFAFIEGIYMHIFEGVIRECVYIAKRFEHTVVVYGKILV